MEKDDVVLIKDIIPNCSMSKKITEMLGTKVKIEDVDGANIKVKGVWIPKEFVKEVTFKHYTEEELARRSKIEEYCECLIKKTTPLLVKIAEFFEYYTMSITGALFLFCIASFFIGSFIYDKTSNKILLVVCFCSIGVMLGLLIFCAIFCAIIKKCRVEENFLKDVHAKTIKSLKVSEEEIERFQLHW